MPADRTPFPARCAARYLITGGAGFLGINLARGDAVTSLDRADFDYPDARDRVRVVRGDVRDRAAVDRALEGADVVVHAAAALPLYPHKEIFSTGIEGTRVVLDAARARGDRALHLPVVDRWSTASPTSTPSRRPTRCAASGRTARPRCSPKNFALRRAGASVTILRPRSFVGPERLGIFSLLYDWAASGRGLPLPGGGDNRYQ